MKRRGPTGGKTSEAQRGKAAKPAPAPAVTHRGLSSDTDLREQLAEALEQQTATTEILRVISRSTFDLQKVFETLVESAARLCRAEKANIWRLKEDNSIQYFAAYGFDPDFMDHMHALGMKLHRGMISGRAAIEGRFIHVHDVLADPKFTLPETPKMGGFRTGLGVPLIRDGKPIGGIFLTRPTVDPFSEQQINLVATFAAQAVIAIENTRLLNELRQRTDDLTESLQQQTATADVLKVISSSPGELEPVFQAMLERATRICEAKFGNLWLREGDVFRIAATHGAPPAYLDYMRREPVANVDPGNALSRIVKTKQPFQISDIRAEPTHANKMRIATIELAGARTLIAVPMLKGDDVIGSIGIYRQEVRPFTDKQIELVQNFAAQAVIAIENTRLFNELNTLNHQLEQRVADQVGEIERMGRLPRFLPPQVADLIVASGTEKQLESHRREITALFCDLRGFTGFSESSDPEDVMSLLRDYHEAIGQIIIKYSGTLERYAGDGVMVIFNDPVPVPDPALRAVKMALEMRVTIGDLIEKWRRLGHDLGFGIGIAHGFATLGTIGFEGRFDYAAIGTVSNVASRLCDEAKSGQILISPRVLMAVEKDVVVEPVGEFTLKGIRRPLSAHNVLDTKSAN